MQNLEGTLKCFANLMKVTVRLVPIAAHNADAVTDHQAEEIGKTTLHRFVTTLGSFVVVVHGCYSPCSSTTSLYEVSTTARPG